MKIKLIIPPTVCGIAAFKLPYGAAVLAAHLRKGGHIVDFVDLSVFNNGLSDRMYAKKKGFVDIGALKNNSQIEYCLNIKKKGGYLYHAFKKWVLRQEWSGYDLVGFSIQSYSSFLFASLMSRIIKESTSVPIIMGGPYLILFGDIFFKQSIACDYMLIADALTPIDGLLESMQGRRSIESVPNLMYRKNGRVFSNTRKRYPIDRIPNADYSGLDPGIYNAPRHPSIGPHFGFRIPYETSRGCAFNCSFCGFCKNHPLEIKSIVKVVDDIKLLTETYGSRWINFVNSEINISNDYMHDLCDAIIGSKIDINWHSYATPYRLDRDLIDKMKESGCHSLYFGAETASNKLLRNMNKPFLAEEMESVIRWTHNAGIETRLFFIAGYPHESENDIKATLEFIKRNKFYITSYEIAHFRVEYGTDIFLNPAKYGIRILRPNFMNPVKWCYEFDEINGLKWKDKVKEIDRSYRRLSQVLEPKSRISLLVDGLKSKISSLCLNR